MKLEHEKELIRVKLDRDEAVDKLKAEMCQIQEDKNELADGRYSLEEKIQKHEDQINANDIEK